jgi:hypothetical protein
MRQMIAMSELTQGSSTRIIPGHSGFVTFIQSSMFIPVRSATLIACVTLAAACGAPSRDRAAESASASNRADSTAPARSYTATNPESSAVPARDSVSAHPVDWTVDLVIQRLTSGGLNAKVRGPVTVKHMDVAGTSIQVPGAELEIYLYGDANAAAQDIDRFDRLMRMPNGALMWEKPPALVTSNNMVILVITSDATVREHVRRVLNLSHMKEYHTVRSKP